MGAGIINIISPFSPQYTQIESALKKKYPILTEEDIEILYDVCGLDKRIWFLASLWVAHLTEISKMRETFTTTQMEKIEERNSENFYELTKIACWFELYMSFKGKRLPMEKVSYSYEVVKDYNSFTWRILNNWYEYFRYWELAHEALKEIPKLCLRNVTDLHTVKPLYKFKEFAQEIILLANNLKKLNTLPKKFKDSTIAQLCSSKNTTIYELSYVFLDRMYYGNIPRKVVEEWLEVSPETIILFDNKEEDYLLIRCPSYKQAKLFASQASWCFVGGSSEYPNETVYDHYCNPDGSCCFAFDFMFNIYYFISHSLDGSYISVTNSFNGEMDSITEQDRYYELVVPAIKNYLNPVKKKQKCAKTTEKRTKRKTLPPMRTSTTAN